MLRQLAVAAVVVLLAFKGVTVQASERAGWRRARRRAPD
jgi:hypothetical protein